MFKNWTKGPMFAWTPGRKVDKAHGVFKFMIPRSLDISGYTLLSSAKRNWWTPKIPVNLSVGFFRVTELAKLCPAGSPSTLRQAQVRQAQGKLAEINWTSQLKYSIIPPFNLYVSFFNALHFALCWGYGPGRIKNTETARGVWLQRASHPTGTGSRP